MQKRAPGADGWSQRSATKRNGLHPSRERRRGLVRVIVFAFTTPILPDSQSCLVGPQFGKPLSECRRVRKAKPPRGRSLQGACNPHKAWASRGPAARLPFLKARPDVVYDDKNRLLGRATIHDTYDALNRRISTSKEPGLLIPR